MIDLVEKVATELSLKASQVGNTVKLLFEDECTIPFVARYRKEMTGSMDEVQLRDVRDRYQYLGELETSKVKYLKVVEEHCQKNPKFKGQFPELKAKFEACETRQQLDDLYLPFKPKRRTRAQIAKEKGLEPLLEKILADRNAITDLPATAQNFVTSEEQQASGLDSALVVADSETALNGAADILAERINETAEWRAMVRQISRETGLLTSKKIEEKDAPVPDKSSTLPILKGKKKGEASKYENYFDYQEPIGRAPSHRVMAVRRGEAEKVLRVTIEVDNEQIVQELNKAVLGTEPTTESVRTWLGGVVEDAYRRLISPSIETELRLSLKGNAEDDAIAVFSKNLQNLLLLPPIPNKVVLGVDPGLRTGSKLAAVDDTGKLLDSATIYPDYRRPESPKNAEAKRIITNFIQRFSVACIAIGNGTGSREIDRFISATAKEAGQSIRRVVVNEAGASVYSTEDIAREEFPDLDATIRSAISIARRLQDPLAELVKINPRSIGVGQYQHDVNPSKLGRSLGEVVESCVNKVGVDLNTASYKLLGYVSGVGPSLAKNIVSFRDKNGRFSSRADVLGVAGFGPKAYQQAAGFLRVPGSSNPLDNSAVHPERYEIIEQVAKDLGREVREIIGQRDVVETVPWERYVNDQVGMPTLQDISMELIKPGRDPREDGARLTFSDEVSELEDLKAGMRLKGTVTNVTAFGAFVDIGVHQDGLVHISELSDDFVKDPSEAVAVGDIVDIRVLEVDLQRRRISLSRKSEPTSKDGQAAVAGASGHEQQRRGTARNGSGGGPRAGATASGNRPSSGDRNRPRGRNSDQPAAVGFQGSRSAGQPFSTKKKPAKDKQRDEAFTMGDLLSKFGKK